MRRLLEILGVTGDDLKGCGCILSVLLGAVLVCWGIRLMLLFMLTGWILSAAGT